MADNKTELPCAIILIDLPVEYNAVRAHLSQMQIITHPNGNRYERGIFTSKKRAWDVVIRKIGAGDMGPGSEDEQAVKYFGAEVIFFVGVAGGLKDVHPGDVVVANKIYRYESDKANKIFETRPEMGNSSFRLVQRAQAESRKPDWLQRLGSKVPDQVPHVFIAPIAAGEKVISSNRSATLKLLTESCSDVMAVEMEGYGALKAANANPVHALVIHGISDLFDNTVEADASNAQELAARHASAFAFEILAKFELEKTFEEFPKSQRDIKDFKTKVDGKWKEEKVDDGDNISHYTQFQDSARYISNSLKNERKVVAFFPESESKVEITDIPVTEEAFTKWYYELDDYEQYYVLTTAVLQGAPVREVVTYTEHLYKFIHDEVERRGNLIKIASRNGDQQQSEHLESLRFADPLLRTLPGKELRKKTFTETRKKKGVECLYWQDADQYGLSTFGLRLLEFLCKEYIVKGELGQFFLNALEMWSDAKIGELARKSNYSVEVSGEVNRNVIKFEDDIDEVTRKVIHSYGVVLWCHDAKKLRRIARSWALDANPESKPISVAELLDGAYEIYKVKSEEKVNSTEISSVVLPLLKKWVKYIHKVLSSNEFEESTFKFYSQENGKKIGENQVDTKESNKEKSDELANDNETGKKEGKRQVDTEDNLEADEFGKEEFTPEVAIKLGYAVASTYALIGKRSPDLALEGLEQLLKLPLSNSIDVKDLNRIFAAGVSAYVILSWSGHIRDVIKHLAASAEPLSHSRDLPLRSKKRHEYRHQREVYLKVTLEAFFLVAAASFTDVQKVKDVQYSLYEELPSQPAIPDPLGRDMLLAFILSKNEVMYQEYITTLLCAAIVERKSREAFGLLRYWAEIVLRIRELRGSDAEEMYETFLKFIVNLGRKVKRWCDDLEKQKLLSPPAFETFKKRLTQWSTDGSFYAHPIGLLAWQVFERLVD